MKLYIIPIFFLISVFYCGCTRVFQLTTYDFDYYTQDTFMLSNNIKEFRPAEEEINKFNQGVYLFPLLRDTLIRDGLGFEWYQDKDLNKESGEINKLVEYAYIAFLDDHRVYYYSSNKRSDTTHSKDSKEAKADFYKGDYLNNAPLPSPSSYSEDDILAFDIKEPLEMTINSLDVGFEMRGYYWIVKDKEFIDERQVERRRVYLELEKPHTKKGNLDKVKRVRFEFIWENGHLIMEEFKVQKSDELVALNNYRVIYPHKALLIVPKFSFYPKPLKVYYQTLTDEKLIVHTINYSKNRDSIKYHMTNKEYFYELRKDIKSW